MTFGPFGVGRQDGKAVMVPGAVAGDRLEVEIVSERRDYSVGKIREIIQPSADRRSAPCPYLPQCGGCDWQHIDYGAQVRFKGEVVARELGHALGIEIDPVGLVAPAPAEFGYRSRIRLRVGAKGALGFYAAGSNTIVEIDSCMVAETGLRMPLHLARSLGKRVEEIEVVRDGAREVQVAHLKKPASEEDLRRARNVLEADSEIAGIVLRSGTTRATIGETEIAIELEDGLSTRGRRRSLHPGESRAEPQSGRERDGDGGDSRIATAARSVLRRGELQPARVASWRASDRRRC